MSIGRAVIRPLLDALDGVPVHVRQLADMFRKHGQRHDHNSGQVNDLDAQRPDAHDVPDLPSTRQPPHSGPGPESPSPGRHGVDRGDGRDDYGRFAPGQDSRPWVDREAQGLDEVSADRGVPVIRDQVRATVDGLENGRFYDGLIHRGGDSYTGVEVKSGGATPTPAQEAFDAHVNSGNPASATLHGQPIRIVEVILKQVP